MMLETELFRLEPDITVLACSGKFTMGTRLKQTEASIDTLIAEGTRKLVLDLTHTEAVDSAGLSVIMHMSAHLEQAPPETQSRPKARLHWRSLQMLGRA